MEGLKDFSERFKGKEKTWVNEVMWYDVEGDNIFIHLAPAAISRQVKRGKSLLVQALTYTAHDMQEKPQLQDTKFLIATSKQVKSNPYIFEQLGFTVFDHGSDEENILAMERAGIRGMKVGITKPDEAMSAISKEELFARYLQEQ